MTYSHYQRIIRRDYISRELKTNTKLGQQTRSEGGKQIKDTAWIINHPCSDQVGIYTEQTHKDIRRHPFLWEESEKWRRLSLDKICQQILELPNTKFQENLFCSIQVAAHFYTHIANMEERTVKICTYWIRFYRLGLHMQVPYFNRQVIPRYHVSTRVWQLHIWYTRDNLWEKTSICWIFGFFKYCKTIKMQSHYLYYSFKVGAS